MSVNARAARSDEYRSLRETAYLLRSPRNAERLRTSIAEVECSCRRAQDGPATSSAAGSVARQQGDTPELTC